MPDAHLDGELKKRSARGRCAPPVRPRKPFSTTTSPTRRQGPRASRRSHRANTLSADEPTRSTILRSSKYRRRFGAAHFLVIGAFPGATRRSKANTASSGFNASVAGRFAVGLVSRRDRTCRFRRFPGPGTRRTADGGNSVSRERDRRRPSRVCNDPDHTAVERCGIE